MKNSIYLVVIVFFVFILLQIAPKTQDSIVDGKIERKIDTIIRVDTIINYDTIIEYAVKYKDRKVTDTVYVETENKPFLALPVVSKHFTKENLYDLWISGYKDVFLDSMRVYISKKETLIEKEKNIYVTPKKEVFIGGGFIYNNKKILPTVSVSQRVNKKTFISYSFGYNDGFYGSLDLNIKIK